MARLFEKILPQCAQTIKMQISSFCHKGSCFWVCVCNQLLPLIKKIPGSQLTASALFQLFFFLGRLHTSWELKKPKGFLSQKIYCSHMKVRCQKSSFICICIFFYKYVGISCILVQHSREFSKTQFSGEFSKVGTKFPHYFDFKFLSILGSLFYIFC